MYYEGKHILFEQFPPVPPIPAQHYPYVPGHNDSIRVKNMTENRGNIFISRCPWWFPKSLILIESEWEYEVWDGAQAMQSPTYRTTIIVITRCYTHAYWIIGPLIGWRVSPRASDWPVPGLTWSELESLGHRVSLLLSAQYFLTIITSSIETFLRAPGHVPLLPILSRVLCWLHHWVSPNRFTTRSNL